MTFYMMAIVMRVLSVSVYDIFTMKCVWCWSWPWVRAKINWKYVSRKPNHDFSLVGYGNACSVSHHLQIFVNQIKCHTFDYENEVEKRDLRHSTGNVRVSPGENVTHTHTHALTHTHTQWETGVPNIGKVSKADLPKIEFSRSCECTCVQVGSPMI